jgi:hypothetical protein
MFVVGGTLGRATRSIDIKYIREYWKAYIILVIVGVPAYFLYLKYKEYEDGGGDLNTLLWKFIDMLCLKAKKILGLLKNKK